jgi:transposase-like protein
MYDSTTGKRILTEQQLAEIVGSSNRQAVDSHLRGFRDAQGDMLEYLQRRRKVDDEVVNIVWQVFRNDPYRNLKDLAACANEVLEGKELSEANVRTALEQVSGYKVWREMLKCLEGGEAHYQESFLLERLLNLLCEQGDRVEQAQLLPEGTDSRLFQGTEPVGEQLRELAQVPQAIKNELEPLFTQIEDPSALKERLCGAWEGSLGLLLMAFILYTSGLSYATIGGWMGVNASTVCRWLIPLSAWGWIWLEQQRLSFSGQVAVDEKWIKIDGKTWYLFVAIDCITRYPLHIALYPSNSYDYCQMFLLELKAKGYAPRVVVTDGWDAYIKAIRTAFPNAKHMLCRFHLIRSVFRRMRQVKLFDAQIIKDVSNLFRAKDKRTVKSRVEKLKGKLEQLGKVWVIQGLLNKLHQVLPAVGSSRWPSTSNAAECFNGAFDRFYRLKGPFRDQKSAQKQIGLFALGYVFRLGLQGQACPLERANLDVSGIPFYHLVNRPNIMKLKTMIADQYKEDHAADQYRKTA